MYTITCANQYKIWFCVITWAKKLRNDLHCWNMKHLCHPVYMTVVETFHAWSITACFRKDGSALYIVPLYSVAERVDPSCPLCQMFISMETFAVRDMLSYFKPQLWKEDREWRECLTLDNVHHTASWWCLGGKNRESYLMAFSSNAGDKRETLKGQWSFNQRAWTLLRFWFCSRRELLYFSFTWWRAVS